jgi:hypothetical protein
VRTHHTEDHPIVFQCREHRSGRAGFGTFERLVIVETVLTFEAELWIGSKEKASARNVTVSRLIF